MSDFRKLDRLGYSSLTIALGEKSEKPRERSMAAVTHTIATNIMQGTKLFIVSLRKKEIEVMATMQTYSSKKISK